MRGGENSGTAHEIEETGIKERGKGREGERKFGKRGGKYGVE